jgi:hypothetical protein
VTERDRLFAKRAGLAQSLAQNIANAQGCLAALSVVDDLIAGVPPDLPPTAPLAATATDTHHRKSRRQ